MVVGYLETRSRSLSASSFHGVVLAGLAHGEDASDRVLERLLQRAEPVTHDRWDPESEQLRGWRAAKFVVGKTRWRDPNYVPANPMPDLEISTD